MQKHPMLSVKEAAEALKLDERSIRERLANGTLKGEKKAEGLREKWYVYRGAVESALEKQNGQNWFSPANTLSSEQFPRPTAAPSEQQSFTAPEQPQFLVQQATILSGQAIATAPQNTERGFEQPSVASRRVAEETGQPPIGLSDRLKPSAADFIEDAEITSRMEPEEAPRGQWYVEDRNQLEAIVESLVKPLVDKVAAQALELAAQEAQIKEQEVQLRLLPDYKKRAEDERKTAELKELEAIALKKQMDAISGDKARKIKEKEDELAAVLEQERLKADALEAQVSELAQSKSALEAALQQEIDRLKEEKNEQTKLVQAQLQHLTQKLEKLEKPWWKKVFSAPEN